jgi:allantoin racemase
VKIWYQSGLDFETHPDYKTCIERVLARVRQPGTDIYVNGRGDGARGLASSDVIGSPASYFRVVTPVFIDALVSASHGGFDVFAVGSFSEPIIAELRSLAVMPVVTMPEAAMLLACTVAPRFALVSISRLAAEPYLSRTVKTHGLRERVSGIYVVEDAATEEDVYAHFVKPAPYLARFVETCRTAIAAGAQAIVPAEGMLAAMVADASLHEVHGAPVVDSIGSTILFAEMAVRLREVAGWQQSRIAYPKPSARAMQALFNTPGSESRFASTEPG